MGADPGDAFGGGIGGYSVLARAAILGGPRQKTCTLIFWT